MTDYQIVPSILSANFSRLGEEVAAVIDAGADMIHFDVMDNHFVPNLTIGPMVCQALRDDGVKAPIDVHLMVRPVDALIQAFGKAGASIISIHPEGTDDLAKSVQLIHDVGAKASVAFNPDTSLDCVEPVLHKLDMLLIMSVHPGFAGQSFIPEAISKIEKARQLIDKSGRDIRLEVDGGIKIDNVARVAKAGADTFVAGSAIFGTDNYRKTIKLFRRALS